jgi:predicted RNA binding protein YcfA (HicA-like mRNA interferase family)
VSPALSDLPVRKVTRALESVGSAYVRTKGSYAVYRNREGRVAVIPLHGVVKRGTLASILRQAALTPPSFSNSWSEPARCSAAGPCRSSKRAVALSCEALAGHVG